MTKTKRERGHGKDSAELTENLTEVLKSNSVATDLYSLKKVFSAAAESVTAAPVFG